MYYCNTVPSMCWEGNSESTHSSVHYGISRVFVNFQTPGKGNHAFFWVGLVAIDEAIEIRKKYN